jgi:hypothetical protein
MGFRKRSLMKGADSMAIKANPEIEAMANQLAALRGQSVEDVLAAARRAELAREPKARELPGRVVPRRTRLKWAQGAKVERMLEMVRAAGPTAGESGDRAAFLYDDQGRLH